MVKQSIISEIIKAKKAIRKKQLALKTGLSKEESILQKHFKPITEPLQKLLKLDSIKKEETSPKTEAPPILFDENKKIKKAVTPTILEKPISQPSTTTQSPVTQTETQQASQLDYSPFTTEEEEEIDKDRSFQQYRHEYQKLIAEQPEVVDEFLEQYDITPRVYIDGLLSDTTGEYDTTTGVYFEPTTNELKLGNAVITIKGSDIQIDNIQYKGTPGLYELIFKTQPAGYSKQDLDRYRDILKRTSVHHRDYNPKKQIRGNKGYKYINIIKPLTFRPRSATISGGYIQGIDRGIGRNMVANKLPYQYVYWDDINELVNRLRLLIASKNAGHTGHTNEITSIVEELRETGVIN